MADKMIDAQFIEVCKVVGEKIKELAERIISSKDDATLDQINSYLNYHQTYNTICSDVVRRFKD